MFYPIDDFVKNDYTHPVDNFKIQWDLLITLVLIFVCVTTPYRISFVEVDSHGWNIGNAIIDILFLIDIIIIFNTAYFNEDYKIIEDRKLIAKRYLAFWFWLDIIAILPFEYMI